MFEFLLEQRDKGVVNLTGEQADKVDDLKEQLDIGLEQLRGENWTRMVFVADVPTEGAETQALLSQIRSIAQKYYGDDVLLVGNSTNALDLANSFTQDNMKISILTVLFVMVILLFTFKSAGLPILLVLTIQGSIWINFTVPVLTHTNLYFLSYLVVSSIQMGATIDYAIVMTSTMEVTVPRPRVRPTEPMVALVEMPPMRKPATDIMVPEVRMVEKLWSRASTAA